MSLSSSSQPGVVPAQPRQRAVTDSPLPTPPLDTPVTIIPARLPENRITIFAAGHGFVTSAGTLTDDLVDYALGTQSVKLVTDGAGGNTRAGKASITVVDMSARFFKLLVKTDIIDPTKLNGMTLYASSDNFAANWQLCDLLESTAQGRPPYILTDEWTVFTVSKSRFVNGAGAINWAAINSVRLSFIDAGAGNIITAHVNLIGSVPQPANGVVSITFDDGWISNYTLARPKLDQYGYPATLYAIAQNIQNSSGNGAVITLAQLQALAANCGWDIGAHAYSSAMHDSLNGAYLNFTDAQVEEDLGRLREWLIFYGFVRGADHFAYPQGMFDASKQSIVKRHFASARSTHLQSAETYPPANPMKLRRYAHAGTAITQALVKTAIDQTIANKDWLILNYHDIVNGVPSGPNAGLQCNVADFNAIVDYLATNNVRVKTVSDVLATGVT